MAEFRLLAVPPFRLDLTAWALRRRANNLVDRWDGRVYRRVFTVGSDHTPVEVQVTQKQELSLGKGELSVFYQGQNANPGVEVDLRAQLEGVLGLRIDLTDFYRRSEGDPILGPVAHRFRGMKPPRFPSVFEALANAIACQQLSLNFGILLLNRLAEAYGRTSGVPTSMEGEAGEQHQAFPMPEDLAGLSPDDLRRFGFSHQKARSLLDLSVALAGGQLDLELLASMDNEAALTRLRQLRGVGRWSAEYALLRGLGRLDVLPGDDVGAQRRLQRWLGLDEKLDYEGVQRMIEGWQPYRGLVYFHLLLDGLAEGGRLDETDSAGWLGV